jgi:AcrR family transcriptional regulator
MAAPSTPTRDRIIEEAMRLFAELGYKGASVARIEAAAGLSPGSGALYHHFDSKEQVLSAGIARHLGRLEALREVRRVVGSLGDLTAELKVTARYFLAELDAQTELLRVLVSEIRTRPQLLSEAVDQLIASTFDNFAEWIVDAAPGRVDRSRAMTVSSLALGSLLSSGLLRNVLAIDVGGPEDEVIVEAWVGMVSCLLDQSEILPG